ncbi:MAG: SDR family oxidoreductase [Selenomonadaceae bacterium]|nr:SDR family oxidoreductase [Selenomonadaceae bacterium]
MENYTLITGASSGVGRETAVRLSHQHNLIINGRNVERLEETKSLCADHSDVIIWSRDLSEVDELESEFAAWLKERRLPISSFVHCAGELSMLPLRALNVDAFKHSYAIHVFAPAILVKLLSSRKFNGQNLKSIVFISSNISERGATAFSVYGSSKAALDGLTRNLAMELAPRIRVNSILPGGMATRMTEELIADEAFRRQSEANYPLGMGKAEDIAPVVEFLLSEGAGWITGQSLTVDGGRTINLTDGKRI